MPTPVAQYDMPENNNQANAVYDPFPNPPRLPARNVDNAAAYHYDENTVVNPLSDALYEIPSGGDVMEMETMGESEVDDEISSNSSNFLLEETGPLTRILYAKVILLSVVFGLAAGLAGGLIGGQLTQPQPPQPTETLPQPLAVSVSRGCNCSVGTIVFAYTAVNDDPCYAVADGNITERGVLLPDLLQKNGLFIRAGQGGQVGNIEDHTVNVDSVTAVASSSLRFYAGEFSADGNGMKEGYYLTQGAMFGITGSAQGKAAEPEVHTNVSLLSSDAETAPVAIRLLPLVCIGN